MDERYLTLRRNIETYLREVAARFRSGDKIIEVGVGPYASVTQKLLPPEVTYIATDVEAQDESGERFMETGQAPVREWDIHHVPPSDLRFRHDWVICSEVLEHVERPVTAMANIAQALKDAGTLIVTVPFYFAVHQPVDYWRFTPNGLRYLARQAGLQVVEIRSAVFPGDREDEPLNLFMEARPMVGGGDS